MRFIPTHVGNTSPQRWPKIGAPVHPHACGEHLFRGLYFSDSLGSSPRMWGTQSHPVHVARFDRFIPTHVGNTEWGESNFINPPVHPHACGEHYPPIKVIFRFNGSSPRMWGTLPPLEPARDLTRFIPTHVGNTAVGCLAKRCAPVHPHACGEHLYSARVMLQCRGSSPRMWGTLFSDFGDFVPRRFIPTHVGNTTPCRTIHIQPPVHPHACGEH